MNATILTVSCANRDEAAGIARALVAQRLAACVHLRPHESIYRWQGDVEEAVETSLLVTTAPQRADAAATLIRSMHSYAVPAILTMAADADPATLAWLEQETNRP